MKIFWLLSLIAYCALEITFINNPSFNFSASTIKAYEVGVYMSFGFAGINPTTL